MGFPSLSPWDAFRWFDNPRETLVNLTNSGQWIEIAPFEIRRVTLLIAPPATVGIRLSTMTGGSSTRGVYLIAGQQPFTLTHAQHGNLVQVAWYIFDATVDKLTVVETLLREWPAINPRDAHNV